MNVLAGILTQGLHIALVVAIAPLLLGAIRWLKARMQSRAKCSSVLPPVTRYRSSQYSSSR